MHNLMCKWMNGVGCFSEMFKSEGDRTTSSKPYPSPNLFTNPAGTDLVSNQGLRGDRPVTNRLGKFCWGTNRQYLKRMVLKAISEKLHPLSSVYECWSNFTANERYINGGPWKLMKWNRHMATVLLGRSIKQSEPQNTLNLKSSLNNCKPVFSLLCKHDCEVGLSCRMRSVQINITRRCNIWACHVFILCEYPHLAREVGRRLKIILLQVPT